MYFVTVCNGLAGLLTGIAFLLFLPLLVLAQETDTLRENGIDDRINNRAASQMGTDVESNLPRTSQKKFPSPRGSRVTDPFPRKRSPLIEIDLPRDRVLTTLDSLDHYTVQREVYGVPIGFSRKLDFQTMSELSFEHTARANWRRLVNEMRRQRDARRGLLDFTLDLPVGERSAFTTIFGRPEVNLRVTGTANMNVGATIRETEDPSLPPDQQTRIDPVFEQNLRLNIQGSIGDKLTIRTDWDTERSFDFENRLSIRYEGYEDEILQSIEMGNVSMQTGNSLIRGGSSLFGIKSEAKFGPLRLTSVVSQQEGQSETQTITGGTEESTIEIRPASYDNDRHFFLGFYARQEFEDAMSDPQTDRRMFNIERMDVYVLNTSSTEQSGQRRAVALTDLGVVMQGDRYMLPDTDADPFDEDLIEFYRDPSETPSASDFGVAGDEFVEGNFVPLEEGEDYTFNESNGYLSLESRLSSNQALAISFAYSSGGEYIDVGDENIGDERRLFLKLLRPSNMTSSSSAWGLTMRNVYSLNATDLTPDDLEVDILFDGGNTSQTNLPGLSNVLLQDLGLDRVGSDQSLGSNNQIDFGTGTLDARRGRIIFPYLEPFGGRIREIYENSDLPQAEIEENINRYAFTELYESSQDNARRESGNNLYYIGGVSTGAVQDSYNLGFALVEGSVSVRANGVELSEGVDYEVDYSIGNIVITNDRYLQSGQEIVIDYESNQMLQIQQTTFAGVRAEYTVNDNIRFGSTYFTLRERPLQDKIPIGDEPIQNSIIGFDGSAEFDAPWLTRAINWIPLLQTRADSDIRISGEFAQLRPNVAQTRAVSRAADRGELYPDEETGLSFIDDFEGSKTTINFLSPGRWNIAAAPHAIPGYDSDMNTDDNSMGSRIARSDMRGKFSWYMIPLNVGRVTDAARTPESLPVSVSDVFPNREVLRQEDRLQTLDIHYNPRKRGPYNYNENLRDLLEGRPEDTWGGMTATLPSGQSDLRQNNVEFLEFWVQPLLPDGRTPSAGDLEDYDGKIYIDLGLVSEDVIPNNQLNTEDGLARAQDGNNINVGNAGRSYVIPSDRINLTGQFSVETQEREDVGLDGAHSTDGEFNEQTLFADWLELMEVQYSDQPEMLQQIQEDPSNDRYYYFNHPAVSDLPLHERFHRMYGFLEGNSLSDGDSRSITNRPDTEGLENPARVNRDNSYFQYEIPMNPADTSSMQVGKNYIVDRVEGSDPTDRWYLVRVPLREIAREVGTIEDLERVQHIRFWMSGYREPMTMRFATFELVGNQWREFEEISRDGYQNTIFDVATVNIEENSNREPIPYRVPNGAIRATQRSGQQEQVLANEQSLSMRVEDLRSGEYRMIQRLYPSGLNLLNFSNLRMFVHGEGYERRSDLEVVIRMGNDLTDNYYEYRQPVSPTDPDFNFTPLAQDPDRSILEEETDRIWIPDSNSVNIVLSSLNALKQARDLEEFDAGELYERTDLPEDAPPGTVIGIKGNPSLQRVREVAIGIRNPHDSESGGSGGGGKPSLDAEVWVNELRVSGADDEKGWAANMSTDIRFADLATVRARFSRSTDGFGALDASLADRQMYDDYSYDLSTTINMHRFIPERYGWNIPVQLSARRSQRTPRFLPQEGDIRFSDFEDAVRASDEPQDEQDRLIDEMLRQIRTEDRRYSVNISNVSKSDSESWFLRNTVDNLTLGYVYNIREESSDRLEFRDSWDYRTSLNYRLNIRDIRVVRPLIFLENVPVLNWISETGFTFVPSQVSFGGNLNRDYSEERRRSFTDSQFDLQQRHNFDFRSNVSVNYNLTQTISTSFSNQTRLNLESIGQRPVSETIDTDFPLQPPDEDEVEYRLKPTFEVMEDWLLDPAVSPRRDNYQESWTASWRPRLNQIDGLDWFNYSASYRGQFRWQNSPEGSGLGANLTNQYSLDQNPEIRTQNLLERISLYERAKQADEQAQQERRRERQQSRDNGESVDRELSEQVVYYGRRFLLGILSIQNLNISYNISGSSAQSGYDGGSQIYHMFGSADDSNFSPPFAYRLGLQSEIPRNKLITNPEPGTELSLRATKDSRQQLNVRSGLRPFSDFTVNVDWRTSWQDTRTQNQTLIFPDELSVQREHSGRVETSVWAFGAGYDALFDRQLSRALDEFGEDPEITDLDADDVPLTSGSLEKDFRRSYLGFASGTIGERGYMPIPLPNWSINWSGWERRLQFLDDFIQRATINHSYSSRYETGWQLNANRGADRSRSLGGYTFLYEQPDYSSRSISLQRSFSPLIGVNITWANNLRTQIQYNRSKRVSISFSNNTITESNSQGITSTFSYSKRGFRIPFFRQLNNQIELNLSVSYSDDLTYTFRLNQDIADALQLPPDEIDQFTRSTPDERGTAQFQLRPSVKYQFSRTINAGLEYSYTRLMPRSTGTYPRTDQDIRVNIQVSIRSN